MKKIIKYLIVQLVVILTLSAFKNTVYAGTTQNSIWTYESDVSSSDLAATDCSLTSSGDVNNDGYNDLVASSPDEGSGVVRFFFGSVTGLPTIPSILLSMPTGYVGFDYGSCVSVAGDVNGDNYSDIAVGASSVENGVNADAGAVFVYYGNINGLNLEPDASYIGTSANYFVGARMSSASDIDKDGYSDLLIGIPDYANGQAQEGAIGIWSGSSTGMVASPLIIESNIANKRLGDYLSTIGDANGDSYPDFASQVTIAGTKKVELFAGNASINTITNSTIVENNGDFGSFGSVIASIGDTNADSYADFLVGSPDADGPTAIADQGVAVLVYGGATMSSSTQAFYGGTSNYRAGAALFGGIDLDKDGYADWGYGVPGRDNGYVYVYNGLSQSPYQNDFSALTSADTNAQFGSSLAEVGDIDGDGKLEFAIGSANYSNNETDEGKIEVYESDGKLGGGQKLVAPKFGQGTGSYIARWGTCSASLDVNGDGYDDAVYTAPGYNNGAIGVSLSQSGNINGTMDQLVLVNEGGADWGESCSSAGDVNNDGFEDFLVGSSTFSNGQANEGAVKLFTGSNTGLSTSSGITFESNTANANMGVSLSGGFDYNADGMLDFAVGLSGATSDQPNEGQVRIYLGNGSGTFYNTSFKTLESDQTAAKFGQNLASGDMNADGFDDLVVAAPYYDSLSLSDNGQVYQFMGGYTGFENSQQPTTIIDGEQTDAHAGLGMAVGEIDGDGKYDLVYGQPGFTNGFGSNTGKVMMLRGYDFGLLLPGGIYSEEGEVGSASFGAAISIVDLDGDGVNDIVVSAPDSSQGVSGGGAVFAYAGFSDINQNLGAAPFSTTLGTIVNQHLGYSLNRSLDFNRDGFAELMIGATGDQIGPDTDGAIRFLIPGYDDNDTLVSTKVNIFNQKNNSSSELFTKSYTSNSVSYEDQAYSVAPYDRQRLIIEDEAILGYFDNVGYQTSTWSVAASPNSLKTYTVNSLGYSADRHSRHRVQYGPAMVYSSWNTVKGLAISEQSYHTSPLLLSGNVLNAVTSSPISGNRNVKILIDGVLTDTVQTDSGGSYSYIFLSEPPANAKIAVVLEGDNSQAATFGYFTNTVQSQLDLYYGYISTNSYTGTYNSTDMALAVGSDPDAANTFIDTLGSVNTLNDTGVYIKSGQILNVTENFLAVGQALVHGQLSVASTKSFTTNEDFSKFDTTSMNVGAGSTVNVMGNIFIDPSSISTFDNLRVSGDILVSGTSQINATTLTLDGINIQSIDEGRVNIQNLIVANTSTSGVVFDEDYSLTSLTINSGGVLSLLKTGSVQTLTVSGAVNNNGTLRIKGGENLAFTNDTDSGTVEIFGDDDSVFEHINVPNIAYFNLNINDQRNDFGDFYKPASALVVNGTLSVLASVLELDGQATAVGGSIFIDSDGILRGQNATINLTGDFKNNLGGGWFSDGSEVILAGTSSHRIYGDNIFYKLTYNATSAVTLGIEQGKTITMQLGGGLTISGPNSSVRPKISSVTSAGVVSTVHHNWVFNSYVNASSILVEYSDATGPYTTVSPVGFSEENVANTTSGWFGASLALKLSLGSLNFGTLSNTSVSTTSDLQVTVENRIGTGFSLKVNGAGKCLLDPLKAGLSNSASIDALIPTINGEVTAGSASYGLQAEAQTGSPDIDPSYAQTGNLVGKINCDPTLLAGKDQKGDTVFDIRLKASAPGSATEGDYSDNLTWTITPKL